MVNSLVVIYVSLLQTIQLEYFVARFVQEGGGKAGMGEEQGEARTRSVEEGGGGRRSREKEQVSVKLPNFGSDIPKH